MHPVLLHILLLVLLAVPVLLAWLPGQPGHQATAAAWALGLLFYAGLWATQLVISSGLIIWRSRVGRLKVTTVIAMHAVSAIIIVACLLVAAWAFGGV